MGGALYRKIVLEEVIQCKLMGKSLFGPVSILSLCIYKVSVSNVKLASCSVLFLRAWATFRL